MLEITGLDAIEILDSRGDPTVKAVCDIGSTRATASVPAGVSTGRHEAAERRDGLQTRYKGLGCREAVEGIRNEIARAVVGRPFDDQRALDAALAGLDATPNKARLGSNSILAVSLAAARAYAGENQMELYEYLATLPRRSTLPRIPRLMVNLFSGGRHAGEQVAIQDVLILPNVERVEDALHRVAMVYRSAVELVSQRFGMRELTADEGGLAPDFDDSAAMFDLAVEAIERSGMNAGEDVSLGVDVAASHFERDGSYLIDGEVLTPAEMVALIGDWCSRYPIVTVEDGLGEDDWDGWSMLRAQTPTPVRLIGDDLLCTNSARVQHAIDHRAADALLLKVNQAGSLTDAVDALDAARDARWMVAVSARSGETEDTWLADAAVGWSGDYIKVGSLRQSDRLAKYNRLLEIETGVSSFPSRGRKPPSEALRG